MCCSTCSLPSAPGSVSISFGASAMLAAGASLASRRVLRVAGEDALKLLQGAVTNDVRPLAAPGAAPVYAAILAPCGRVAHDVHLHREMGAGGASGGGAVLADLPAATFDAAVSLLRKMRLRARVTLDDAGEFPPSSSEPTTIAPRYLTIRRLGPDAPRRRRGAPPAAPRTPARALPVDPRLDALGARGSSAPPRTRRWEEPRRPRRARGRLRGRGGGEYAARGIAPRRRGDEPAGLSARVTEALRDPPEKVLRRAGAVARTHHAGVVRKRLAPVCFAFERQRRRIRMPERGEEETDGGDFDDGDCSSRLRAAMPLVPLVPRGRARRGSVALGGAPVLGGASFARRTASGSRSCASRASSGPKRRAGFGWGRGRV